MKSNEEKSILYPNKIDLRKSLSKDPLAYRPSAPQRRKGLSLTQIFLIQFLLNINKL